MFYCSVVWFGSFSRNAVVFKGIGVNWCSEKLTSAISVKSDVKNQLHTMLEQMLLV